MKCNCSTNQENDDSEIQIRTVSGFQMNQYIFAANQSLASVSSGAAAAAPSTASFAAGLDKGIETQLHITPEGDALVSSSFASGNEGDIVLRGMIGAIPYEIHLKVSLDGSTIVVTLQVTKPIPLGPFTWRFNLGGIVTNDTGDIIGATSVALIDTDIPATAAGGGFNWWCVLKCGGTGILPVLLMCLPALAGGPAAFVSCVVAKVGGSAAGIAVCVAQKCLK